MPVFIPIRRASRGALRTGLERSSGVLLVATALLLSACGDSGSEPGGPAARSPGRDEVAIEVTAAADAPESGGGSAIPGLWLVAVPERLAAGAGARANVDELRDQGAELVRTDGRGRATLSRTSGPVVVCDLGSSDAASPVAALAGCPPITVTVGRTLRLTFGEAGLRLAN